MVRLTNSAKRSKPNIYQNWSIKLFALPLLLAIALIGYVVSHPNVAKWVADGVQAEFVGTDMVPDLVPPTRVAQPANQNSHNQRALKLTRAADWRRARS